jgi:imidazolonepropionase-like amidohydrolase
MGYSDVALRDAIEAGEIVGPRVYASGPSIGISGGHCDMNLLRPEIPYRAEGVADGPDAVRAVVRRNVRYGADVIKYCGTGGVFSKGTVPGRQQFTAAEVAALIDEARMHGRKVAVHAHGAEGIKVAIRAGVDSVEHASLIDDEGLKLAKERGTFLSMDIYNTDYTQAEGKKNDVPEEFLRKDREVGTLQRENFRKAVKAGIRLTLGSDAGIFPHGDNARQFAVMTSYGMTPMQAIQAATVRGAELLGAEKEIGTLAIGAHADLVAVTGDPLADVRALEKMEFVMKGGTIYAGPGAQPVL